MKGRSPEESEGAFTCQKTESSTPRAIALRGRCFAKPSTCLSASSDAAWTADALGRGPSASKPVRMRERSRSRSFAHSRPNHASWSASKSASAAVALSASSVSLGSMTWPYLQSTPRNRKESEGIGRNRKESEGIGRNPKESEGVRRNRKESEGVGGALEPCLERADELRPRVRLDAAPLRKERDRRAVLVAAVVRRQQAVEAGVAYAGGVLQVRLAQLWWAMQGRGRSVADRWKASGRPWKVSGRPWKASGRPLEGHGRQWKVRGRQGKAGGRPVEGPWKVTCADG